MVEEKKLEQVAPRRDEYEGYRDAVVEERVEANADQNALIPCIAGRYDVLECMGQGSQGEVYRARRRTDGAEVAIKVMHIKSVKNWKMYELFHREAQVLSTIDIEGVAKFYEAIEDLESADPVSVIVQQFVDGHALSEFIKAHHRFLLCDIADILIQLTKILERLHHSNPPIIHRDIKPSNIMLEDLPRGYRVWLIDFGAVANPQVKDGGSTVAGTYGYMAPEQLMGQPKPASDLYSMAVMAFYMLTGVPPEAIEVQDFRLLIDPHLQNLPFPVTVLLRQMLEPHIDQRLTDTNKILRALEQIKKSNFNGLQSLVQDGFVAKEVEVLPMKSYKQGGCVEQWDALSDVLPRKLPSVIEKRFEKSLNQFTWCSDDTEIDEYGRLTKWTVRHRVFLRSLKSRRRVMNQLVESAPEFTKGQWYVFWSVLVVMLFLAIYCSIVDDFSVVVFLICFFYMLGATIISTWRSGKKDESAHDYTKVVITNPYKRILPLLEYGRKTLASVVSIEFELYDDTTSIEYRPLWKVTYAFNPVDDSSEEDLLRYFYTRREPTDLKPGDLIPCIYIIANDEKGEYVYSMPWPVLEFDDVYLSGDICKLVTSFNRIVVVNSAGSSAD